MPPLLAPTRLVDYPWVVVRVDCVLCQRAGRYRLARLAARYGPEQSLTGLLADLAHDCPWWRSNPRKYEPRCGIRLVDLDRALPPPDHPDAPLYRQRQPDREDLPRPKTTSHLPVIATGGAPRLSDWPHARLELVCEPCRRREVFEVAELRSRVPGGDMTLLHLRSFLTDGCPSKKASENRPCEAAFRVVEG